MDNKEFVKMHMALECTSDNLLLIYDRVGSFWTWDMGGGKTVFENEAGLLQCIELMELFCDADADINRLSTLRVITKSYKNHELMKAPRKRLLDLLDTKLNKEFVEENLKQTGTKPLKEIHNRIKDFIAVDEFEKVNELIELFLKADADIGRLRSILVITKYWRNDATIEANLKKAVELLKAKTGREVV